MDIQDLIRKVEAVSQQYSKQYKIKQSETPLTYQVHHPPLYFISALLFFLPASFLSKGIIPVYYATRLASTVFYFLSVYIAYLITLKILKKKKSALYLTAAFALNPVALKMGIAVNPDIASTSVALLVLYYFITLLKHNSFKIKALVGAGVLAGVSSIVKFQNTVLFAFSASFFFLKGMWAGNWKIFLGPLIFVSLFAALFALPWIIHSFFTYQTITPSARAYTFFCTANLDPIPWWRIPFETIFELRHAFFHFAGFLGWGEPYPFKLFFYTYALLFISLMVLGLYQILKTKERYLIITGLFAFFVTLFFLGVSLTYKINRYSCDIQGRYLLSALLPFIVFAHSGLQLVIKKKGEQAAYYIFLFTAWQFYFILFFVLIPRYYV